MTKHGSLAEAIAIAKEFAQNDVPKNGESIVDVIEKVYASLNKLGDDANR